MARQTVRHGAVLDAATPAEVADLIAAAFTKQGITEYRRAKDVLQLDATGAAISQAGDFVIPSNYDLLIERICIGGTGAANALIGIYENDILSDTNLLEIIQVGAAGKYSDGAANTIYVTANSAIIVAVTGGVANGQVAYNMQGRLRKHA